MKELIEYIVKTLADVPSQVRVDEVEGTSSVVLELRVAPEDMGRIIGRKGRVANAMRTLLRVLGGKQGKRVTLEIVESPTAEAAAEGVVAEEVAPVEEEAPMEEAAPIEAEVAEEVSIADWEVPSEEELIAAPLEEEIYETTGE
jgi:predicted RNA-binding protein YlqC (UPF0109 family)